MSGAKVKPRVCPACGILTMNKITSHKETKAKLDELIAAAEYVSDTQCDNGEGLTKFNAALRRLEATIEKARA